MQIEYCVCPYCRDYYSTRAAARQIARDCHTGCNRCVYGDNCRINECDSCLANEHVNDDCQREQQLDEDQRRKLQLFRTASSVYWPHHLIVTKQNESYRNEKENLQQGQYMFVFDFAPVAVMRRQQTQEDTRSSGMKMLIFTKIEVAADASSATTTTAGNVAARRSVE